MRIHSILASIMLVFALSPIYTTPASAQRETVTDTLICRSVDRQRIECPVGGRIQDVQPVASFSGAPCVFGSTWGFDRRNVWVDQGCYAQFSVEFTRRQGGDRQNDRATENSGARGTFTETIDCRSEGYSRQECRVKGKIENVEKVGTFSIARCRLNETWGSENRYIWVDRGCQARFNVTFTRRSKSDDAAEPISPTPVNPPSSTAGNIADAPLKAIVAQGACTGLFPSSQEGGYVFAVPRQCANGAPDCQAVCAQAGSSLGETRFAQQVRSRSQSCFNSIHAYSDGAAGIGAIGTRTYVYNSCTVGGCGPNICCCAAQ